MSSVNSTAVSAVNRMRSLWLASTALVGIRLLPQPAPSVLHLPSSPALLQARMARLLALAIETPASLLARLNPLRSRKVRPAARVGRRKWQRAALAAAASLLLTAALPAHAQTWNGTTSDYNTNGNWNPAGAPIGAGQSATFANTGSATVNVSAPIAPNAWTFNADAQSYAITGSGVNFAGTGLINNDASGTIRIANVIGGVGSLQQFGTGTLVLTSTNTYTGGTTVSAGRVIAQNTGNALGSSGTVAIGAGATVELNNTGTNGYTIAPNTFNGAGTIEKTGTGAITFGGNGGNTNISLSQGGLINVREGTLGGSSSGQGIWTNNRGSLNVAAGASVNTVEAAVFIDALTGAGTYAGGFQGTRTTTIGVAGGIGTFSGTLEDNAGTGGLAIVKTGAGTQTFSGANTYTGGTRISGGALQIGDGGTTGSIIGNVANNASLIFDRNNAYTFAGTITGSGNLTQAGTGTLTLSGTNTYTGGTTFAAGTINAGSAGALGTTGALNFTGGALQYSAANAVDYSGRLSTAAGQIYRIDTNGRDVTFANALTSANGSLNKFGAGTLTLTGANTYNGTSIISGGTLAIGVAGGATGTLITSGTTIAPTAGTTLTVNAGSLIRSTGSVTISNANGAFTINNAGTIDSTSSNTIQNGSTTLTLNNTGTVSSTNFVSVLAGANSRITNSGTITGGSSTSFGYGIEANGLGTQITNQNGGIIQSTATNPVRFDNGGTLINQLGGTIRHTGTTNNNAGAGVYSNGNLTLINGGRITTTSTGASDGVTVLGVGNITNTGTRDGNGTLTGGLIQAANASGLALVGAGSSVTNSGTIQGGTSSNGVNLNNGGTITNQAAGLIAGSNGGIISAGSSAAIITNDGTIRATAQSDGIMLGAGGTINNGSATNTAALIAAAFGSAINNTGSAATIVNNYGRIQGTSFSGAGQASGTGAFTLNNLGTASIVYGTGNFGTYNAGTGTGSGLLTVTNQGLIVSGGTTDANAAVYANGAATITNSGRIGIGSVSNTGVYTATTTGASNAMLLNAGGAVLNQAGGTIQGGGARGITSNAGLTLTNLGTISGTNDGLGVLGGASSVLNVGTISSSTNSGIAVGGAGATLSVTNATRGTITGGSDATFGYGLGANGRSMTVNNYGSIGSGARGLTAVNDGTVTANLYAGSATGSILGSGGNDTVSLYTGAVNAAAVTTPYADAVTGAQSTVTLQNSGAVAAATVGGINLGGGSNTLNLGGTGTYDGVTGTNTTGARGALNMSTVSGLTTLNKQDSGTFVLTGGYGGALTTNVQAGRLIAQNTGNAFGTGTVTISSGAVVELNSTGANRVGLAAGTFTGDGRIQKTGTGNIALGDAGNVNISLLQGGLFDVQAGSVNGSSSGQGIWTDNKGSLNIASGATFDGVEGAIVVDRLTGAGTLRGGFNGTRTTTVGIANGSDTFTGTIQDGSGPLALTKAGTGTQTLAGTSTYTGATTINGGTLLAGANNAFAAASATTVNTGGTLDLGGFAEAVNAVALAGGTITNGTLTGAIASTGGTVSTIAGGATLATTAGTTISTGNTYTGATTVGTASILRAGAANGFSAGSAYTLNGTGTLDLDGTGNAVGSLASAATTSVVTSGTAGAATLTAGGNGATTAFAGTIRNGSGTVGLTKAGAGALTLSGANTYSGATTVSAGTLRAGAANVISTASAVAVNGGTFDLNNFNQSIGALSGSAGTTVSLGSATLTTRTGGTGYGGAITGTGNLVVQGTGNQFSLGGTNAYTGTTTVRDTASGFAILSMNGSILGSNTVSVESGFSTAILNVGNGAGIANTAAVTLSGTRTPELRLQQSTEVGSLNSTAAGSIVTFAAGTVLTTGRNGTADTFAGNIGPGGNGALTKTGTGTLTLSGANTYTGATTVSGGTLQIGNGGRIGQNADGTVFSNVATAGGTLAIARSDAYTYGGLVTGSGTLAQTGNGTTTLTGINGTGAQFTGTANVTAGTLAVNGTFGDTAGNTAIVNVNTNGTLHGTGTIAGSVVVGSGGTVSAGNSPGTLTVGGNYTLDAGSTSLFEFGSAGVVGGANNDLIRVDGNLRLGGTLSLVSATNAASAPVSGAYRLYDYGGTLAGTFGTVTTPSAGSTALVYTNIPTQVNVLLTNGNQSVQYFDGADTTGATAGGQGGTGTWNTANTNWTTLPGGQVNDVWRSGVGIFGGTVGTVTVAGTQDIQGLQFTTTGYALTGGSLNLGGNPFNADTNSFITVDANVATTIGSALVGSATVGLTKLGAGTLTLTGNSGYSGGTILAAGTLNAGGANALGTAGTLAFTGGTLQYSAANAADYSGRFSTADGQAYRVDTNGRNVTYATGLASQGGSLAKLGAGTLTLTGASTYAGATAIDAGTLQVGNGGATGSLAAASAVTVAGGTTLALNRTGTLAFGNAVSGAGALTVNGATGANDSITLFGALRQTGGFTVADASNVTLSGSYSAAPSVSLAGGGTFTNQGSVNASSDAILTSTSADTAVVNAAGAQIVGGFSGVIQVQSAVPAALAVTNSGLIRGNGYDGVTQHGTGALTVTNNGTGVIYGQNGTMSGNGYGVGSDGGGVLTLGNALGGTIVGQYAVVGSNVGDQVANAGTIASGTLNEDGTIAPGGVAGVDLRQGGTVINQTGGLIQGGGNALRSAGALVLRNAGTIASPSSDGIVTSSTFDIRNAGMISSSVNSGIAAVSGSGTIVNATGGTFTGGSSAQFGYGVQFAGGSGTIENYGTLNSTRTTNGGSGGIYAYDRSGTDLATVTANLYAGSTTGVIALSGGDDTVALYTGTGTAGSGVVNTDGVRLQNAGTLAAAAFGTIDLGGGTNTLTLRGAGDGTVANGAAGTLALGSVSGAGTFNKLDAGTWTLTGQTAAPLAGMTATIDGGILAIDGVFGDTAGNTAVVNVNANGTLHGTGTIAGSVVVNGGTVSAGNSPGTLTVNGDYTLNAGATSLFELGARGVVGGISNDLIAVGGNLQLGGTLSLVAATNAATAPVSGAYRIYNYDGALSGTFGTVTTPTAGSTALVYTNIPTQVNVLLTNGNQSVQYFDGADSTGATAGGQGGTGTWSAAGTNWTTLPAGQVNDVWRSGVGIFGGSAGTVTVAGAQNLQGLQFVTDGYRLGGPGTLNLAGDVLTPTQSFVNVDSGVGVTIANTLTATGGTIGLRKLGDGSLTLTGASTFAGTTTVSAGTLAIAAGGSVASAVVNAATFTNAGTVGGGLTNTAGTSTNTGTINGGATILAGTFNTNAATSVVNGTLANNATVNAQGQINGAVSNHAGARLNVVGGLTGVGRLTNDGAVDLGGNGLGVGSLSGTTAAASIVGGGTLLAGSDNTSSSYAGTIRGATALTKAGTGTLTLSGANSHAGATTVSAGTLQAGAVNALSAASAVTVASTGRMDLNGFNQTVASLAGAGSVTLGSATLTTGGSNATTSYAGTISGTGGVVKTGSGGFTLSGANGFTGLTAIQAGTLTVASGGSLAGSVNNAAGFTNAGSVAGSLTNSGSATNTGTVSGGVSNSGSLATSGAINGGLTNTGTVTASAGRIDGAIANNAGTVSISGTVASNGTFANAGGATLAVTGTGAYGLGGLLTNAGSLTVASGGSLTAPAGIVNSGSIRVAQGGTITDALANTGSVVNDGAYNADVSNAASGSISNSATGIWTGNLTANTGGVSNAGQWRGDSRNDAGGSVANTGTWTTTTGPFANAGTLATSGVLNGGVANTGSVQASGQIVGAVSNGMGASFALTGALTGVTTFVNDGTLNLGGTAFTVGSLSGTNAAATLRNGALTTNGDNSSTAYAGMIADGAAATSLTKNGTGSLTLTGTNTYTGGTIVNAGTIVAAAAGLGNGPVTNNSDLIVDQANDATLGSAIDGTGRFVKRGAGALTYTGTGTLSGATTVATGRLSVNGGLANSVVTVANAATLGGTGTVGGIVANAGSAVAPGAAPGAVGTLRVAGNVLFAAQSLYQVDATAAGQSDRIAATGTATLQGGTVQVTAQAGLYNPTTSYTILSAAGGLTGRFAGVTSNFAYLTPFLTYDANDAYLRLARNDLQFGTTAQSRNQGNVANAAQATGVGARLYDAIAVLSAPQSRVAFDALSGEIHASAVTAQFENAFLVREAVLDRLRWGDAGGFGGNNLGIGQRFAPGTTLPGAYTADVPGRTPTLAAIPTRLVDPNPVAVWGQGFGSFGSTATDGNAARLARQTSGFVLGADARVENDWRVGAAGGYSFTNLDITGRLSSGTVESGYGALYAGGPLGAQSPLQLRLGATYGGNSLTTRRAVTFAGFSENAGARYGGTTAQGFAEVGYRVGTAASYFEPFIGGAAIRLGRDGFSETGGASALTAQGRDYDLATSTVGLRAEGRLSEVFATDMPIMVRALVGYRRAYGDVVPSALLAFAGGQQFVSAGIPIDRDALVAQAGIDWQMAPSTTLGVNYTGQVGQRAQDHGVKGNFTYRF
ncbi:autotransporter-associated beta strand repeat-containing protein [Methylobacterium thuringiense]|uniref:Autotransporter domain-containing protein n=1 Tax=Methylobacterium thuringiense TaxID=1003091 RepID=A0ABQ4TPZ5_9HYPH|nr:autotransporter-associated beta strand repeat-containing protein [Methylobacterium thuringiense]GJE57434.1 hypothetical protein EKPJFOCH_3949 [Methylobacterium thuringiense]